MDALSKSRSRQRVLLHAIEGGRVRWVSEANDVGVRRGEDGMGWDGNGKVGGWRLAVDEGRVRVQFESEFNGSMG